MDFRAKKVLKLNCAACGAKIDPGIAPPLSQAACPACGAEVEVPAQFDHYLLLRQLGSGSSGFVFKAFDTQLHRQVAIKVLLSEDDGAALAKECVTEARTLAALNHRSIVSIYGLGEVSGQNYMVMELVTGGDLEPFTKPGQQLSEIEILDLALAIVQGLRAAHQAGLVHMDIKPSNILIDEELHPKLIDFGAAQYRSRLEELGPIGTPYYMAPETVRREPPDLRSDMYSFGATLFHLLASRPPFQGNSKRETIEMRLHRSAPSVMQFSDYLHPATDRVVSRMMHIDPSMRYATYDELLEDLERARHDVAVSKGLPTVSVMAPPPEPPPPDVAIVDPIGPAAKAKPPPSEADLGLATAIETEDPLRRTAKTGRSKSPRTRSPARPSQSPKGRSKHFATASSLTRPGEAQAPKQRSKASFYGMVSVLVVGAVAVGALLLATNDSGSADPTSKPSTGSALKNTASKRTSRPRPKFVRPTPRPSNPRQPAPDAGADLIAHWPLDGSIDDVAPGKFPGLFEGEPKFVAGKQGQAIDLKKDQMVHVKRPILAAANQLTIAMWINARKLPLDQEDAAVVFDGKDTRLELRGGRPMLFLQGFDKASFSGYFDQTTGTLDYDLLSHLNSWTHLAVVYDRRAATISLFVDGKPRGDVIVDKPVAASIGPLFFGGFDGALDDVRLYDRRLGSEEILAIYNGQTLPSSDTGGDVIFADFEGGDYGGWVAHGNAFGSAPAGGALRRQLPVTGYLGRGLVNTYLQRDKSTGALTSPRFEIKHRFINFLIGGGNHPDKTCINLIVGARAVRTATGRGKSTPAKAEDETLLPHSWDVGDFIGQDALIQIIDQETGSWGHINVDQIVFSDRPAPTSLAGDPTAPLLPEAKPPADAGRTLREFWLGATSQNRQQRLAEAPTDFDYPTSLSAKGTWGRPFVQRLRGLIHAPHSGQYTFTLSADGHAVVGLSESADPAALKIVVEAGGKRQKFGVWKPADQPVELEAGKTYYLEIVHTAAAATDRVAVGWKPPVGKPEQPIAGSRLLPGKPAPRRVATKSPQVRGVILRERYAGFRAAKAGQLAALVKASPYAANLDYRASFEGVSGGKAAFAERLRGYLYPPVSGDYQFWISGSPYAALLISTDETPENLKPVAACAAPVARGVWADAGKGKAAVALEAGKRYYVEAIHGPPAADAKTAVHLAVGWQLPDGTLERPLSGRRFSPALPAGYRMPEEDAIGFVALPPVSAESSGKVTLTTLNDQSIGATQADSDADYTVELETDLTGVTALRLEAIHHESLPADGPGYGPRGSFSIGEIELTAAPKNDPARAAPVEIREVLAAPNARGSDPARLIDGDPDTVWNVRASAGVSYFANLILKSPLNAAGGTRLSVTLKNKAKDNLGRFRLLATTSTEPEVLNFVDASIRGSSDTAEPVSLPLYVNLGANKPVEDRDFTWLPAGPFQQGGYGYDGGVRSVFAEIKSPIAQSAMIGINSFRVALENGNYRVKLLFSDNWSTKAAQRVFSVTIEGFPVLPDIDLANSPGPKQEFIWPKPPQNLGFAVADGMLDIVFTGKPKSLPLVNAIVIERATSRTTIAKPKK